jgi:hypothetical protein
MKNLELNSVLRILKAPLVLTGALIVTLCSLTTFAQNGINVSEAKVYDDRTLMIMLEQLNEQLRNINFIDRTKLAAQLGLTQGYQSKDVSRSLDIGTLPIPGLTIKSTPDSEGNLAISEQTETRAGYSPTRPGLPELQAAPPYAPVFGENAADLLSDQVNLTYQIFNLRMILERSLSDRLWTTNGGATFKPRLITVIGFDVDLNPPRDARDYAAFVEITITPTAAGASAPALVALMPQEKTYNSVALNTKSNAFGGSAVAKIITIGYSERRRGQTFYLFRDTDTATLTFPQTGARLTRFGWVFRPVLGRPSVTSEKRHMFAVVALPEDDSLSQKTVFPVRVDAHTAWRKYNRDTLTTNLNEKFGYGYALSTNLLIPTTAKAQEALQPTVKSVNWFATDDRNAIVTVEGENFFTGTSLYLGSSVYDAEANGLLLKSSQNMQVRTTLSALTAGDPVLNARYGATVPLYIQDPITTAIPEGVKINEVRLRPQHGRKLVNLSITLQNRDAAVGKDLLSGSIPSRESLILAVQGTPLSQPYDLQDVGCTVPLSNGTTVSKNCVLVQALVPTDLMKNEGIVSFRYPFRGSLWADSISYYDPSEVSEVSRLGSSKSKKTTLAISGRGFNANWKVQLDKLYATTTPAAQLQYLSDTLMTVGVDDDVLSGYKNLIVLPNIGDPVVRAIPPSKPPAPDPALDDTQTVPTASQNTAPGIELKGTDLGAITKVTFEGRELPFKPGKGGKSIIIFLSRRVTAKPGTVQVLLWAGDAIIPAKITVQ